MCDDAIAGIVCLTLPAIAGIACLTLPGSSAPASPACSWHMFDAVIVVISLTLELSLRGVAQEVASLLIFFRWVPAELPVMLGCLLTFL